MIASERLEREIGWIRTYISRTDQYGKKMGTEIDKVLEERRARHEYGNSASTEYVTENFAAGIAGILHALGAKKTEEFDTANSEFLEKYRQRLESILTGKKIMELGARHGALIQFLNAHGAKAVGYELDQDAIEVARRLGTNVQLGQFQYMEPRFTGKFDLVFTHQFFDPLWMLEDSVQRFVNRVNPFLKNRGLFVNTSYSRENLKGMKETMLDPRHLNEGGMKVLHHAVIDETHISIARKTRHLPFIQPEDGGF